MYETGDAAIRDKDGRYQIAGRMDDIINIGRVAKPRFARAGTAWHGWQKFQIHVLPIFAILEFSSIS